MRPLLLLLSALALLAGCHHDPEAAPAVSGYDELALADGHWEWERTTQGFSGSQSPATVGYTRQLVFTPDGRVLIGHGGRVFSTTTYQLSMGTLAGCGGQPNQPIITFANEDGINAGPRKAYRVATASSSTMTLSLAGDYACVDGGAYESFHWVAE